MHRRLAARVKKSILFRKTQVARRSIELARSGSDKAKSTNLSQIADCAAAVVMAGADNVVIGQISVAEKACRTGVADRKIALSLPHDDGRRDLNVVQSPSTPDGSRDTAPEIASTRGVSAGKSRGPGTGGGEGSVNMPAPAPGPPRRSPSARYPVMIHADIRC